MSINRGDLLRQEMKAEIPKRPEVWDESKLSELSNDAVAIASMCETRGWKIIYKKFIEPRLSLDRVLQAQGPFKRAEACAAVRELDLLMKVIAGTIKDGAEANEKLEALRK